MSDPVAALQEAFWQEAERLLLHHTNPWELDEALTAWGYGMGACEAQDLFGLEKVLARARSWPGPILPRMVAEGRMGKSGGVGYYRYPGGGGAVIDPLIEDLIREEAWFGKVAREERDDGFLVAAMNGALRKALSASGSSAKDRTEKLLCEAVHFPDGQTLDSAPFYT